MQSSAVAGNQVLAPSTAQVPLEYISPTSPNLLTIQRTDGLGRLYYHTVLNVNRPVEEVRPLNSGIQVERVYCASALNGKVHNPKVVHRLLLCNWRRIKP